MIQNHHLTGIRHWFTGLFTFMVLTWVFANRIAVTLVIEPEECHFGAIAFEIVENGFRLPFMGYIPESYQLGMIINGILFIRYPANYLI